MNIEITFLGLSIALGFFQLILATSMATSIRGTKWNLSSRGEPVAPLPGMAGRIDRAFQNFKETFPFFAAAILLVVLTGEMGELSRIGATLYFLGRLVYLPLYAFDVIFFRTIAWTVSCAGIMAVLLQMVF